MSHTENAILLTAKMIQRRNDMRRILGTAYKGQSDTVRAIIRGVAKENGESLPKAALRIAREMSGKGVEPAIVIAGLVDELEGRDA